MSQYSKILVVDDDKNITALLSQMLGGLGHTVDVVHDAHAAMDRVESEDYFVVIADIELPGMSGIDLLRLIKTFNSLIQVFIMTAHSSRQRVVECLKAGATDYFQKPLETEDVVVSLKSAIYRTQKWAKLVISNT